MIIFTSDHGGDPRYDTNCPHRVSKWTLYEGGIRVPFMISWPEVLKPEIICNDPIGGIDFSVIAALLIIEMIRSFILY